MSLHKPLFVVTDDLVGALDGLAEVVAAFPCGLLQSPAWSVSVGWRRFHMPGDGRRRVTIVASGNNGRRYGQVRTSRGSLNPHRTLSCARYKFRNCSDRFLEMFSKRSVMRCLPQQAVQSFGGGLRLIPFTPDGTQDCVVELNEKGAFQLAILCKAHVHTQSGE